MPAAGAPGLTLRSFSQARAPARYFRAAKRPARIGGVHGRRARAGAHRGGERLGGDALGTLRAVQSRLLVARMAAHFMLRRRGVASVMHFGAARGQEKRLDAHAWLDCRGRRGDRLSGGSEFHRDRLLRLMGRFQPSFTSIVSPPVLRSNSAALVRNTWRGVPVAAQTGSSAIRSASMKIRGGLA